MSITPIKSGGSFIMLGYDDEKGILCNMIGCNPIITKSTLDIIRITLDDTYEYLRLNNQENTTTKIEPLKENVESYLSIKPPKTFVYLMIDHNTGYYKIGKSKNPKVRESTLQSEKPTIELLFSYMAEDKEENNLHKIYSSKRVRGEWFALDNNDLDHIKNHLESCSIQ